jgi:hypothetical protein
MKLACTVKPIISEMMERGILELLKAKLSDSRSRFSFGKCCTDKMQ